MLFPAENLEKASDRVRREVISWAMRKLGVEEWRKMIKDVRWSGWVWVGECFFWYWPTRVVPDQRPLNGCVCVSVSCRACFNCIRGFLRAGCIERGIGRSVSTCKRRHSTCYDSLLNATARALKTSVRCHHFHRDRKQIIQFAWLFLWCWNWYA